MPIHSSSSESHELFSFRTKGKACLSPFSVIDEKAAAIGHQGNPSDTQQMPSEALVYSNYILAERSTPVRPGRCLNVLSPWRPGSPHSTRFQRSSSGNIPMLSRGIGEPKKTIRKAAVAIPLSTVGRADGVSDDPCFRNVVIFLCGILSFID